MRRSLVTGVAVVMLGRCGASTQTLDNLRTQNSPAALTVDIRDYAQLPPSSLSQAVAEASAIFQDTGVSLVWQVRRRSVSESSQTQAPALANAITVLIHPPPLDERIAEDPSILGAVPGAAEGGRLVYLFSSRIEVVAKRNRVGFGTLLGVVLAHEMGHVLLKGRPHSRTGVMRSACAAQQIQDVLGGHRRFNADETLLIRRRAWTASP